MAEYCQVPGLFPEKITHFLESNDDVLQIGSNYILADRNTDPTNFFCVDATQTLGKGGFGQVCLAYQLTADLRYDPDDKNYICKMMFNGVYESAELDIAPNYIQTYLVVKDDIRTYVVQEYIQGFDLADANNRVAPELKKLALNTRLELVLDLVSQVLDLQRHTPKSGYAVGHGDIKPQNVRIQTSERGHEARIIDLGSAQAMSRRDSKPCQPGNINYVAPELASSDKPEQSFESDIYMLVRCLYLMLSLEPPFSDKEKLYDQLYRANKEKTPEGMQQLLASQPDWSKLPDLESKDKRINFNKHCVKFLRSMYHHDQSRRPDVEQVQYFFYLLLQACSKNCDAKTQSLLTILASTNQFSVEKLQALNAEYLDLSFIDNPFDTGEDNVQLLVDELSRLIARSDKQVNTTSGLQQPDITAYLLQDLDRRLAKNPEWSQLKKKFEYKRKSRLFHYFPYFSLKHLLGQVKKISKNSRLISTPINASNELIEICCLFWHDVLRVMQRSKKSRLQVRVQFMNKFLMIMNKMLYIDSNELSKQIYLVFRGFLREIEDRKKFNTVVSLQEAFTSAMTRYNSNVGRQMTSVTEQLLANSESSRVAPFYREMLVGI